MQTLVALLVGKLISKITRTFKIGGGTAAPGLYALKVDPNLVEKLVQKIPKNIIITGTNGKTTTSRMVAHFAKEAGLKVIRNHTGSNLERGIASTLITHARPGLMRLDYDLGVWELDEAAFNSVAPKIKPDIVVFLNVFRDQLDRYGEVDTVVKKWCKTLTTLTPQTVVLVNGDDANTAKLADCFMGKAITFGVKDYKLIGESLEKKESGKKLDFEATNVVLNGLNGSTFQLNSPHPPISIHLPLPGIYHIYDAVAAIACTSYLSDTPASRGEPIHRYTDTLKHFQPAFGRVEKLPFGYIFLIKNPAAATQVFETIAPQIKKNDRLLLALNDNLADGTDVSWIWDAEFEKLPTTRNLQTICSGSRAYDLANRLKYAGFDPGNIIVENDLKKALKSSRDGLKGKLFILPTYTAMLELQKILARSGLKKHYWEEE